MTRLFAATVLIILMHHGLMHVAGLTPEESLVQFDLYAAVYASDTQPQHATPKKCPAKASDHQDPDWCSLL